MKEQKPEVPEKAKQVSEARSRWEWVESSVWTNRMLEALEKEKAGTEQLSANILAACSKAWNALWQDCPGIGTFGGGDGVNMCSCGDPTLY